MVPLLLSLLVAPAQAGGWSDFAEAFPTLPCSDGWAGCLVGDTPVSAEPIEDGAGVPTPGDLRVGWFSLQGQPAFDPFGGLSTYRGERTALVRATGCPDGSAPPCGDDLDRDSEVDLDRDTDPDTRARADIDPDTDVDTDADTDADSRIAARPTDPPEEQTQVHLTTVASPSDVTQCGDVNAIEREAMLGRLSEAHQGCLERIVANTANAVTARSKASRPLFVDAWYRGDKAGWERLVVRHLDEIERSDPDIALKYASYLARAGRPAPAVIRWADVALENRHLWQKDQYVRNTLKLRGLKARAAGRQWQALEEAKAAGTAVDEGERTRWRTSTVTFAREWWEYSESAGKPAQQALALCISAAGTEDACH